MSRRRRIAARALAAWCTAAVVAAGVIAFKGGSPTHGQVVRIARGMAVAGGTEEKQDGFSVRKEAGKFNDNLEDFERYRDKKAWELAFRSLEQLGEAKKDGMVPAGSGFFVPSRVRLMQGLTSLPPDGRQAFRLFYDAKAKQLLDRAEAATAREQAAGAQPVDEIASLREVVDKYFISSVGDRAADRLGDALFEAGDFSGAAAMWGAVLKDFPDTSLQRVRLHVKRCTALARTGQWGVFEQALRDIRREFAGERLTIGGKHVVATEYLEGLRAAASSSAQATTTAPTTNPVEAPIEATGPLELPRDDKPAWQVKLLDEPLKKKLDAALGSNMWGAQWSTLRSAIPASATDGRRVYVNWLGVIFAADVNTGKLVWRSRAFSQLGDKFQYFINMMYDTDAYTATLAGGRLFVTGIPVDRLQQYQEPVRLVCMNPVDGKVKWNSASGATANWNIAGAPVTVGDVVYVAARPRQGMDVSLLALGAEKGDILWQLLLGTAQGGTNYRGENEVPMPVIVPAPGGSLVYVLTNNGALIAVDTVGRRLQWAYTYEPPPIRNSNMGWSSQQVLPPPKMRPAAFIDGATLYLKEEGGAAVHAVDLAGPALLWRRPLDRESSILPLPGGRLLSFGQDFAAIDIAGDARRMAWSAPMPPLIGRLTPLVGEQRVLAFAPRGIYEIDLADGDTVRIFRGYDRDSIGGTLWRAPGRLIAVSNLAVTAYPTGDHADAPRRAAGN